MRRVLWLAPALALLSLGACAPTLKTQLVGASSGAPLAMPGYDWHLNEDAEEASLSYGMAETDDVPLDLSCRPGSGALQILQTVA